MCVYIYIYIYISVQGLGCRTTGSRSGVLLAWDQQTYPFWSLGGLYAGKQGFGLRRSLDNGGFPKIGGG